MRTRTSPPVTLLITAVCMALAMLSPAAHAAPTVELDRDHTDAFYIVTDSGAPVPKVANGIKNTLYDPDDVAFRIAADTFGTDYAFTPLGKKATVGYFTASENAAHYFEPGWSAPGFKDNGFREIRIEFTKTTGPGSAYLFGNDPLDDEGTKVVPYLAQGKFEVTKGTSLPILGHTHAHWFFTHAGTYTLTGVAVGVTTSGQEKRSEPFTTTFRVSKSKDDTRTDGSAPTPPKDSTPTPPKDSAPTPPKDSATPGAPSAPGETPGRPAPSACRKDPVSTDKKVTLSSGHVDLFNVIADGPNCLHLTAKDDTGASPVLRHAEDVTLAIGENTRREIPKNLRDRLPATGYVLPQNGANQDQAPFPGWDTSHVAPDFSAIDLEIVKLTGPGRVFAFQSGMGGIVSPFADGRLAVTDGTRVHQKTPAHVHATWVFEKPGTYTMTVRAAGRNTAGTLVTSKDATYTWTVGKPAKDSDGTDSPAPKDKAPEHKAPKQKAPKQTAPAHQGGQAPAQRTEQSGPGTSGTAPAATGAVSVAATAPTSAGSDTVGADPASPQAAPASTTAGVELARTGVAGVGAIGLLAALSLAGGLAARRATQR